jgi:uncharacterized RDD family membrane protein YckC
VTPDTLRYAGFWPRLGSMLLDFLLVLGPLGLLFDWTENDHRLFAAYWVVPDALYVLFFNVWMVRRFGGTPGKLIVGIRIRKINGEAVGYREAMLRHLPDFMFMLLDSIAWVIPLFHLTDAQFAALGTGHERGQHLSEMVPHWYNPLMTTIYPIWIWGELLVILTNRKRRALHDFIAGTVVVYASSLPKKPATEADQELTPAHQA